MRCTAVILVLTSLLAAAEPVERGFVAARQRSKSCIALVVGNGAYARDSLRNAPNDGADVAAALEKVGFTVTKVINANRIDFQKAVDQFGKDIRGKQAACFYFAGHGIQVKGENYLVPVGEELNSEEEVPYKTMNAGLVLAQMEAAACPINLMVLDACRNNTLARSGRSVVRGLAQVQGPAGTLIVYATAAGQVALDGDGRNGPFTGAFLHHLATPGQDIAVMMREVNAEVQRVSGGRQVPWQSMNLTQGFCFVPGDGAPTPVVTTPSAPAPAPAAPKAVDSAPLANESITISAALSLEIRRAADRTTLRYTVRVPWGDGDAVARRTQALRRAKELMAADLDERLSKTPWNLDAARIEAVKASGVVEAADMGDQNSGLKLTMGYGVGVAP